MSTTPQMGLVLPTPGPNSAAPDWGNLLNTAFSLIDVHDHTAGHGVPIPSAGISINADLPFNGWNLTQARTLRLQPQAAAPALASDAGCLYVTTAGDLWMNNGAGQHIQITSGAALSAASLGGISGLGGTSAGVAFNNATKTFTFTQAATQAALLDAGPLVIRDTAASAFGITLQSPVGIAGAYSLTLPAALPASNALLSLGATGVLSAFGTVSGNNLALAGSLSSAQVNWIIQATGANAQINIQGNRTATDAGADVVAISSVHRTAGSIFEVWDNNAAPVRKLAVDYQGLLQLGSQAGPIQPASIWTAITPDAGVLVSGGAAYWKDANGIIHLKGTLTNNTGGSLVSLVSTTKLPAGFRPATGRTFAVQTGTGVDRVTVGSDGSISQPLGTTAGNSVGLDGVTYLAEA